jgi:anaerobic ribonucleoside-triphosphate reductase activating protein
MAIWFQGCNILCEGCCNPDLQPLRVANIVTINDLIEIALYARNKYQIEGVTLLGGEPTLQENLTILAEVLRINDFGIILFTGKKIGSLSKKYISYFDLIIDGQFDINQKEDCRNLIGSKNQTISHVTHRYIDQNNWFFMERAKRIEINFSSSTQYIITGDYVEDV